MTAPEERDTLLRAAVAAALGAWLLVLLGVAIGVATTLALS